MAGSQNVVVRRATSADIPAVVAIYDRILTEEELGHASIGWIRGIYPTEDTANAAMRAGELFIYEEQGTVLASARINREQVPAYQNARWSMDAPPEEVMVLHTLTVDPSAAGKGIGTRFVQFYEQYARIHG